MSTWGTNIQLSLFGESHGEAIGIVISGLPPHLYIDEKEISKDMNRRRPGLNQISTSRKETDQIHFISGVLNNYTTGAPLCALIYNEDHNSSSYDLLKTHMRPGHSDYPAYIKYNGANDIRGGGHFSGRLTAPIVLAGAIAKSILKEYGIIIASHILSIKDVYDDSFDIHTDKEVLNQLLLKDFPIINDSKKEDMHQVILNAKKQQDSVGGVLECMIYNIPAGIGNPFFDSLESKISQLMFSIPGVKNLSFGDDMTKMYGSEANDEYYYDNDIVKTKTNHNGGILGGLSTGMPVVFKVGIKPTPSISKIQNTVNIKTQTDTILQLKGRHDPCIVPRANVVVEAMAALAVLDLMNIK